MFPKAKVYVSVLLLVLGLFNGPAPASAKTQARQSTNPALVGSTTFETSESALLPGYQSSGAYGQVY